MADDDLFGLRSGNRVWGVMIRSLYMVCFNEDNGVKTNTLDGVTPNAPANMAVDIDSAFSSGAGSTAIAAASNLAISTAHVSLDRYDLIVARFGASSYTYVVITGCAGSGHPPHPVDDGSRPDIPIAIISVPAGTTAITDALIIHVYTEHS